MKLFVIFACLVALVSSTAIGDFNENLEGTSCTQGRNECKATELCFNGICTESNLIRPCSNGQNKCPKGQACYMGPAGRMECL